MSTRWKIGFALLVLGVSILVCSILPRWQGHQSSDSEAIALFFEVNTYYWEVQDAWHFAILDFRISSRQKKEILVVDLTITNESERSVPLMSWYVTAADGQRFDSTILGDIPFEEDISVEVIQPGATIQGKVAFQVPRDQLPLWIHCAEYTAEAKIH